MHLVLMTRGINRQVEEWKHSMLAQRFAWKVKNLKTNKEELKLVQGALRPIQLWEYIFPQESLNDVLKSLNMLGQKPRLEMRAPSWMLRKFLKLEQIPTQQDTLVTGYQPKGTLNGKPMPPQPVHILSSEGVAVYPIGIKRDNVMDHHFNLADGSGVDYYQEGL